MQRKTFSIVFSLLALSFMLSLQLAARAQTTFHRAAISGTYHLGTSPLATGFSISATSYTSGTTHITTPGGGITVASGPLVIHTGVASVTMDTVTILGKVYKHAKVVGMSYLFLGVKAHAVIDATANSPLGTVGFMVVRDTDGVILAASWPNGFYQQFPLQTGGMSMF